MNRPVRLKGSATEDVAVARKILQAPSAVVGLFAAGTGVDAWPTLLRLGRAIGLLTANTVGIVRSPEDVAPERRPAPDSTLPYQTHAIEPDTGLTEIVVHASVGIGEMVQNLERAVRHARAQFSHILIDLGGYLPDAREVLDLPDAFVSAAVAGRTREAELRAAVELLPTSRHLGTLLVD